MAKGKKSFVLYTDLIEITEELSDKEAGLLFKTILRYVNDKDPVIPKEIKLAFIPIKQDLKRDLKKYEAQCERINRINEERKRKTLEQNHNDIDTTSTRHRNEVGCDNDNVNDNDNDNVNDINKENIKEKLSSDLDHTHPDENKTDLEPKALKPVKHKFGTYGWVRLTQDQYDKLVKENSKEYIDKMIEALDEYIQSNGNKNKYKDFNLVLRKAIRENWFDAKVSKYDMGNYDISDGFEEL